MPIIAPSLLAADFLHIEREVNMVNHSDAGLLHLDVMDGRFVPNISYGIPIIAAVKKVSKIPLDVHLMIVEPEKYLEDFAKAGADILSVHLEASPHLHRTLQAIHALGMKAGVAINPHTPVSLLADVITDIDLVCMMSVNPGFGGQKFIPQTLKKITELKQLIAESGSNAQIEIDGGVTLENAGSIVAAGADILVAGNTVFSHAHPADAIKQLKASGK